MADETDDNVSKPIGVDPIVAEAMDLFDRAQKWEAFADRNWLNDYKFAEGDSINNYQWEDKIRNSRIGEAKPCLTVNKTRQHNLQIINDSKQNKPAIKIRPTGNGSSYDSSRMYAALSRHIEYRSKASMYYDQATGFQVKAGIGYLRVVTDYVSESTFDQEILIRGVANPLMVKMDPDAKEPDKSDSNFCFIFEDVQKKEFKKKYPQWKDEIDLAGQDSIGDQYGWMRDDYIRVAEYYRRKYKQDVLISFKSEDGRPMFVLKSLFKSAPDVLKEVMADAQTQTREVTTCEVMWYFIIGTKVVDKKLWLGKYIPVVPVIGEETIIEGQLDRKGHTRALRDPQSMYNYWSPLALNTPLPTPNGWTTMSKVQKDDWLFDENGKPVQVVGTSPVHLHRQCYRVEFDDGSHIIADAEHKWAVEERGKRKTATYEWHSKTVTTKELTPKKHFIYATAPFELPAADLPIHPYVLGAWLGDGDSNEIRITSGKEDIDNMRDNLIKCGYAVGIPNMEGDRSSGVLPIYNSKHLFRALGLIGNKHIPAQYLRASKEQREQLLMGLMDTDGSFAVANNVCDFTTVSDRLAQDFSELLRSLGIKAVYCRRQATQRMFPSGNVYECQPAYQFNFTSDPDMNIFKLDRKRELQSKSRPIHKRRTKRHRITSVEEVASTPVKCVAINSTSHLFLAGEGMVPTHNSAAVEFGALQSKTPYIAPAEAVEGYEVMWNNANRQNYSVLLYNSLDDAGQKIEPPRRQEPPVAAPVAITGMQVAQNEMAIVSGQFAQSMGEPGTERTGKAINERQRVGENATYHFIDNLAMAIRQIGRIIIDISPKVYDTPRLLQIADEDGSLLNLMIDPQQKQAYANQIGRDGKVAMHALNPQVGLYEVEADIGPDYGTKRQETFNALSIILTQAPQLTSLIGDLLLKSADFNLANEAAERLRRMVPPHALGEGPSQNEQQLMTNIKQLTDLLANAMDELTKTKAKVRDHAAKRDVDIFNAITQRLKTFLDAKSKEGGEDVQISRDELDPVIREALIDAMSASLDTAHDASQTSLQQNGGTAPAATPGAPELNATAPGVRMGADEHPYMRDYAQSTNYRPVG